MKGDGNWDIDLHTGLNAELELIGMLGGCEVKCDLIAHRTGRVFVEHACNGKPSGLAITRADWWAFGIKDARMRTAFTVLVPVWRLRELSPAYPTVRGGDRDASEGVLIPLTVLVTV